MANNSSENRRPSMIIRYNSVHDIYNEVLKDLGRYAHLVPKSYIYEQIHERTGLSSKTISRALNHFTKQNVSFV